LGGEPATIAAGRLIQRNTVRVFPADSASSERTVMTVAEPCVASLTKRDSDQSWIRANWGLLLATAVLAAILALPTPADLPVPGHRMLAILSFAVIVWMTEAVDYAVSALIVAALMALLLVLVAAALFLAAMTSTGLDKRIALTILSRAGPKPAMSSSAPSWSVSSSR
jgi:hypothetical protein